MADEYKRIVMAEVSDHADSENGQQTIIHDLIKTDGIDLTTIKVKEYNTGTITDAFITETNIDNKIDIATNELENNIRTIYEVATISELKNVLETIFAPIIRITDDIVVDANTTIDYYLTYNNTDNNTGRTIIFGKSIKINTGFSLTIDANSYYVADIEWQCTFDINGTLNYTDFDNVFACTFASVVRHTGLMVLRVGSTLSATSGSLIYLENVTDDGATIASQYHVQAIEYGTIYGVSAEYWPAMRSARYNNVWSYNGEEIDITLSYDTNAEVIEVVSIANMKYYYPDGAKYEYNNIVYDGITWRYIIDGYASYDENLNSGLLARRFITFNTGLAGTALTGTKIAESVNW